jgi:hypothetical protein
MNLGVDFPETNGIKGTFEVQPMYPPGSYPAVTLVSLQFAGNAFTAVTPYVQ